MRRLITALVASTTMLAALLPGAAHAEPRPASAHPAATHTASSALAFVSTMLDQVPLTTFSTIAGSATHDAWFDWTTDWCSAPLIGNTGRSFNFTQSCRRHDFGYRNLPLIERRTGVDTWNHNSRLAVDRRFLADMRAHCASRSMFLRPTCYAWAQTFYGAVRIAGGP